MFDSEPSKTEKEIDSKDYHTYDQTPMIHSRLFTTEGDEEAPSQKLIPWYKTSTNPSPHKSNLHTTVGKNYSPKFDKSLAEENG